MLWQIDANWTLFLDRDGVINERLMGDYVKSIDEFKLLPGVAEAIAQANRLFHKVVVVTNQQGIGKKRMTACNLHEIHSYCSKQIEQVNGRIDAYFFASNLVGEQPDLRKPAVAMAIQAKEMFPAINWEKSVMVGDTDSDIQFGENCGMKTVFVSHSGEIHPRATMTVHSLKEFIEKIQL
jgi:histidinol-phosphate phosphatase family protein